MVKVLHVSFSDSEGGAARAAFRTHQALLSADIESRMFVNRARLGDWTVSGPKSRGEKFRNLIKQGIALFVRGFLKSGNAILHSPSFLNSTWPRRINRSDADIVHLHWVQSEMLSIADIRKIRKPLVWTMHDMWLFCGAEHYTNDLRWKEGYDKRNRPPYERGLDLNRWVWRKKKRMWREPIQIITPTLWLSSLASESSLTSGWPVATIGHSLDLERWRPVEAKMARKLIGLPVDTRLILFGAMGGGNDPRKGFDLLAAALEELVHHALEAELVVFGESQPEKSAIHDFPVHYMGQCSDDVTLRILYSACDVLVFPSRLDNPGLTAVESMACGTPVVGFHNSGLPMLIDHQNTGYLARAFDAGDLARGITWAIDHPKPNLLRRKVRAAAENLFEQRSIAAKHVKLYTEVLARASQA